ncbi:RING-H2 finger protein ATL80-like [Panicum virgatum]|uniref:RING-H2 finger protein ATL80-like n=1 Tax=Panicum virgatum TaxID=38727 RepID=UPI0019D566C3|nr:RING-H2 finger protein ATL80-like [Panicum virgatum]
MAGDGSHVNVSTMAAQEPHADPELLPRLASPMEARNTEEFANMFARFLRLAPFRSVPPAGPRSRGERAECAACLEGYAAGDTVRTLPCSHGFHGHCILRWLAASRLCPLCRFAMPAEMEPGF